MKLAIISSFLLLSAIARIQAHDDERPRKLKKKGGGKPTLSACISPYPGYTGDLDVSGSAVQVSFDTSTSTELTYMFNIMGAEPNCANCGTHIHAGTTCDDASLVLGHYWDTNAVQDPWTSAFGAVYNTDAAGKSMGMFVVDSGYNFEENNGHAVVFHAQDGTRIGCGVLSSTKARCGKSAKKSVKAPKASKQAKV